MKVVIYQLKSVTLNKYLYRCAFFHQSCTFIQGSALGIQCVNDMKALF